MDNYHPFSLLNTIKREELKLKEKICGIYCIENIIDNKKYIGLSVDVYGRKGKHFSLLKNNKHINDHLQSSYNLYGKDSFKTDL